MKSHQLADWDHGAQGSFYVEIRVLNLKTLVKKTWPMTSSLSKDDHWAASSSWGRGNSLRESFLVNAWRSTVYNFLKNVQSPETQKPLTLLTWNLLCHHSEGWSVCAWNESWRTYLLLPSATNLSVTPRNGGLIRPDISAVGGGEQVYLSAVRRLDSLPPPPLKGLLWGIAQTFLFVNALQGEIFSPEQHTEYK